MAAEPSPAFQFYPKDFLSDPNVVQMSLAAKGVYILLLCYCWLSGGLPSDFQKLSALAGCSRKTFSKLWSELAPCFCQRADGTLIQPRLERERDKQAQFRELQRAKGIASAGVRLKAGSNSVATERQPEGNSPSSSPSSSSISDLQLQKSTHTAPTRGAEAGGDLPDILMNEPENVSEIRIAKRPQANNGNGNGEGNGLPDGFDAFWAAYPKKVGKDAARRAWKKRRPGQELTEQILAAVARHARQDAWMKEGGQYIPGPAKWLNEGRWQDEPSDTPRMCGRTIGIGRATSDWVQQS